MNNFSGGANKDECYYSMLGYNKSHNFDPTELKKRFRQICLILHPDKNHFQKEREMADLALALITRANKVLSDPFTRRAYDGDITYFEGLYAETNGLIDHHSCKEYQAALEWLKDKINEPQANRPGDAPACSNMTGPENVSQSSSSSHCLTSSEQGTETVTLSSSDADSTSNIALERG